MKEKPSKYYIVKELLKLLDENPDLSVLDMGSGRSENFLKIFKQYPEFNYTGIELRAEDARYASELLKDYPNARILNKLAYLEENNEVTASYDIVLSLSVLEHVKDLESFLSLSAKALKLGGEMIHLYDLGHSLHPSSWKERVQIFLSNNIGWILPEKKYCAYIDSSLVVDYLQKKGLDLDKITYHNQYGIVSALKSTETEGDALMDRVVDLEQEISGGITNKKQKEYLFPSVCLWLHKNK